ncbi:MAG: hypothetical protein IPF54_21045 [Draconibacterium sp.]|nr:hypothetical protein [Draconibacterium sp.]
MVEATLSTQSVKYGKILTYNPNLLIRIEHDRLIARANIDSSLVNELVFGKSGINFEVFPASIIAEIKVLDTKDSIIHQIGIEVKSDGEKVLFQSATQYWLINKMQWTLAEPQFLTYDKTKNNLLANLEMNSNEGHISLNGESTDTLHLDLNNIDLSYLAIPIIAEYVPQGILSGNIKYSKNEKSSVELELEMLDTKWNDITFKKLTASGFLKSDSTGINDGELIISADDSLSFSAQMESNSINDEFLIKSKFNKLQFQLVEPFIAEYANNLHGSSSGEVTIGSKNSKMSLNGEVRFNDLGLKIIPLETKLSIPNNKIIINENKFF